ncbi:high-affinity nickel-transport family protein [Sphingobacteriales bacterium CHB3]|nr:high-affinity nickel-transport family protein [Sphingobacteriales bacterium CHB3]
MHTEVVTILSLGFFLGLKHALDADHLVAITTMVSDGKGILQSSIIGALWGFGHTLALVIVGSFVIALGVQIPENVALLLELGVAAMLIILGVHVLIKLFRGDTLHVHTHAHHGRTHIHPHTHPHTAEHSHDKGASHHESVPGNLLQRILSHVSAGKRSILIGIVHGMAGSAALMLVVLATISSTNLAIAYIAVFGVGSIGGMMLMSTAIGLPFMLSAARSRIFNIVVRGIAGVVSVAFGLFLGWHIGFVEGLFLP